MCGFGIIDRISGAMTADMWSVPCGELATRSERWTQRLDSEPSTNDAATKGTLVPAGVIQKWHAICHKAEALFGN